MSIVVTCATAKTAGAALQALAAQNVPNVKAVVRSEEKGAEARKLGFEVAVGDLTDQASLNKAFEGAKAVFVMNPPHFGVVDPFAEARQTATTLKQAIQATKPERVVVLSSWGADIREKSGIVHASAIMEEVLGDSAKEVVIVRATGFYENALNGLPFIKQTGTYTSTHIPIDKTNKQVATEDIGRCIARYLTVSKLPSSAPGPQVVYITGPTDPTPTETGNAIGAALGREIKTAGVPDDQLDGFLGRVLPPHWVEPMATMIRAINSGIMCVPEGAHLERGTVTPQEFFKKALQA